jgi:hypothetical protein
MICQARKGFLTLSGCENPATTACSNCGRMMCTVHLAPQSGFTMCYSCAATNPQQPQQQQQQQEGEYDETWAAGYRDTYYHDTGYTPVAGGAYAFNRHDRNSFTNQTRDGSESETETGSFDES